MKLNVFFLSLFIFSFSTVLGQSGDDCANAIPLELGDDLMVEVTNQSTCGLTDNYEETCLGVQDSGPEKVYTFTISTVTNLNITVNAPGESYKGMAIFNGCPDVTPCLDYDIQNSAENPLVMDLIEYVPGTYYLMVDSWQILNGCLSNFDITITGEEISCLTVSNLSLDELETHSASLSWDDNGDTAWDYALDTSGFDISSASITTINNTGIDFPALDQGVFYDFYVRTNCGNGDVGAWSFITFKTIAEGDRCDVPIVVDLASNLNFTDLNQNTCSRSNFLPVNAIPIAAQAMMSFTGWMCPISWTLK